MLKIYRYRRPNREGLILETEEGLGEIAPLPGLSRETLQEAEEELLFSKHPRLPSVLFGIACAQIPFPSRPLPIRLAGLNRPPNSGYAAYKLKAKSPQETLSFCRPYLGSRLRLDCNQKWTFEEALFFTSHFSLSDFEYLEEPIDDPSRLLEFAQLTGYTIAQDESLLTHGLLQGAIPIVKPTLHGGLFDAPYQVLSSAYESGIGLLHIARLSALWPDTPLGIDTFSHEEDPLLPLEIKDGFLYPGPLNSRWLKRIA